MEREIHFGVEVREREEPKRTHISKEGCELLSTAWGEQRGGKQRTGLGFSQVEVKWPVESNRLYFAA